MTLAQACDASSVSFTGEGQDVTVPPLISDPVEEKPLEEGEDGVIGEARTVEKGRKYYLPGEPDIEEI